MTQQSAMQELISYLEQEKKSWYESGYDEAATTIQAVINKAEELLPTERQNIVDGAIYGNGRASVEDKQSLGEQYYTQTFNDNFKK